MFKYIVEKAYNREGSFSYASLPQREDEFSLYFFCAYSYHFKKLRVLDEARPLCRSRALWQCKPIITEAFL